jgi:alkylation response protein AidB-like acyl-CoA dehydrogenase
MGAEHVDLGYGPDQVALADAVAAWAARHATDDEVRDAEGSMPAALWAGLAELGVLGLATEEGRCAVPGPLVATFLAGQLLDPGDRADVAAGKVVVAVGTPPLVPWAPIADVYVELDPSGRAAWLARRSGAVEAVETLGGEPWGRVALERIRPVDGAAAVRAVALGDLAVAAYLAGAAQQLVDLTAEWARDRKQFGRSIGEFQSVAHPLTDVAIRTGAARSLARMAAYAWDHGPGDATAAAAAARQAATRAGLDATYRAHQAFGALGYTVEGPVALLGRRVRQVSLHPPGPAVARQAALAQFDI